MLKITPNKLVSGDDMPVKHVEGEDMRFASAIAPVPLRILEEKIIEDPHNATERLARLADISFKTDRPDISVVAKALLRHDLPKVSPPLYNAMIRALY